MTLTCQKIVVLDRIERTVLGLTTANSPENSPANSPSEQRQKWLLPRRGTLREKQYRPRLQSIRAQRIQLSVAQSITCHHYGRLTRHVATIPYGRYECRLRLPFEGWESLDENLGLNHPRCEVRSRGGSRHPDQKCVDRCMS